MVVRSDLMVGSGRPGHPWFALEFQKDRLRSASGSTCYCKVALSDGAVCWKDWRMEARREDISRMFSLAAGGS